MSLSNMKVFKSKKKHITKRAWKKEIKAFNESVTSSAALEDASAIFGDSHEDLPAINLFAAPTKTKEGGL